MVTTARLPNLDFIYNKEEIPVRKSIVDGESSD